ncbi:MAG TPA: GspE/PulE family protein [Verrucomicrobiae bacterium]|nr:GspE/PulE family protein [Verrucomicrobiae bacterium]
MYPSIEKLKSLLLQENYISEADNKAAEAAAHDSGSYVDYLIREQLLSKALLGQAIAESYKLSFADLNVNPTSKELVLRLPLQIAQANRAVVIGETDQAVLIATDQPAALNPNDIQAAFKGKQVQVAYTLPEYITLSFGLYEQPLETRFSQIIQSNQRVAPEIVDEIIKDAAGFRASDIHFEPRVDEVVVRFRVDGDLRVAGKLPKENYENVLNRIKVESGMRIDEHLAAQDGTIQRMGEGFVTDLRVSLVPTVHGEKVVMRVLSSYVQDITLADIGLSEAHRKMVEVHAAKPFGMILTVGPTGSGKTTTLYSLLKFVDKPNVNITTIEDPVEYKMSSVNQIQVQEQGGMSFARGLRAIVRQDPDIILVGEIRDQETAEISVNAALTGHLLLSTFHANDAATAIPRLIDMGIEPFLLASTLEVIIAQRLVRRICQKCRYSVPASESMVRSNAVVAKYFAASDNVYAGKGCNVCNGTGYTGRISLFEFIEVTDAMQDLIVKSPSTRDIIALARKQGNASMFDDGVQKVKSGITTINELLRVVEPPLSR